MGGRLNWPLTPHKSEHLCPRRSLRNQRPLVFLNSCSVLLADRIALLAMAAPNELIDLDAIDQAESSAAQAVISPTKKRCRVKAEVDPETPPSSKNNALAHTRGQTAHPKNRQSKRMTMTKAMVMLPMNPRMVPRARLHPMMRKPRLALGAIGTPRLMLVGATLQPPYHGRSQTTEARGAANVSVCGDWRSRRSLLWH